MIPSVDTARTVLEPQPHWLIADWLEILASSPPGEDKAPSPHLLFLPHLHNSDEPRAKTVVPGIDTARHVDETLMPLADH